MKTCEIDRIGVVHRIKDLIPLFLSDSIFILDPVLYLKLNNIYNNVNRVIITVPFAPT
jgi:hypothetical protein